jgi:membrane fusion protein (multidrug efflux system)
MKRWFLTALISVSVFLFIFAGCGGGNNKQGGDKKKSSIPVEISLVSSGDISTYFTGTATIEAEEETEVVAKVHGVVEELKVEEGDFVRKGDILARLDDEQFRVRLNQAEASLKRLEALYNRNLKLHEKGLISTEEFQQSKFDYRQQKAAYQMAELDLKYTRIRTPIEGVVSSRMIKVGNMVLQNSPTFRVTGLNPLIAVLHIPEKRLESLQEKQQVKLRIDALGGRMVEGRIARISPVVDPGTGTVKVTVETIDESRKLKPGMFARVSIIHDIHRGVPLLPKDAIISEDTESVVFVLKDSTALRKRVTIGFRNTSHVEVLAGLEVGDTVVTTGKSSLKDSSLVEVVGN